MKRWVSLLSVLVLMIVQSPWWADVHAQPSSERHQISVPPGVTNNSQGEHVDGGWEGSAQAVAYSEFNHRFAGLCMLLFGLAELGHALRYQLPFWTRLVLPGALGVIGMYLLIWSDHEAWPIGSLSFAQTFFGQDQEIIQHKFYGVFGVAAAVSEMLRRIGWAHAIELHHALLGGLGIGAAVSNGMVSWTSGTAHHPVTRWEMAWAGFVIVMGVQLLLYVE